MYIKTDLLYADCPCGWKYRGRDADELEHLSLIHDPGSSCCFCSGMLCQLCIEYKPHMNCIWDCPECCAKDVDGYTNMDRQRATARWFFNTHQGNEQPSPVQPSTIPETDMRGFLAAFAAAHPPTAGEEDLSEYLHKIIDTYNKNTHSQTNTMAS